MVVGGALHVAELDPGRALVHVLLGVGGELGAPQRAPNQRGQDRVSADVGSGVKNLVDEPRAVRGEQHRRAVASGGLEVDRDICGARQPAIGRQGGGPEVAVFLSVGEREHDVVSQPRARAERPRRLEERRHARSAIARSRARGPRVVVSVEEERPAWVGPGKPRDDVRHRARLGVAAREPVDGDGVLEPRVQPERAEPADDVPAGGRVGGPAGVPRPVEDRPGRTAHRDDVTHGPVGGELALRRRGGLWRRRRELVRQHPCRERKNRERRCDRQQPWRPCSGHSCSPFPSRGYPSRRLARPSVT